MKRLMLVSVLYLASFPCARAQGVSQLPSTHSVKLDIEIQTTVPVESAKKPAPVYKEIKRISGTLVGTAVLGRIKDIVSRPDTWAELAQHDFVPVFTAHSEYRIRDAKDYSKYTLERRYPLKVSIDRTEMDYVNVKEGGKYVEKYTKVSDFKAEGVNEAEAFSIQFFPYHPTAAVPPLLPHYVLAVSIGKYTDKLRHRPAGNGQSLKWDYDTGRLTPDNNPLYIAVGGTLTEKDPDKDDKPLLVRTQELNNYFLNPSAGPLTLKLSGSSYEEANGKRHRTINVTIELMPIRNVLQTPIN